MTLAEFRAIIDFLCVAHANAKIDFVYPVKRGDKPVSKLGDMSGYRIILSSSRPILRIDIDWAREEDIAKLPHHVDTPPAD